MTPCQYEGRANGAVPLCRGCTTFIKASELEQGRQETEQLENLRNQMNNQPNAPRRTRRGR
jgi:hypothetical protein